jgi:2-C-methyl-D-erythritol 4-phosphate cytidylyltransferase
MSAVSPARDVGVVIVAGGSGTRAGGADAGELKQFRWIAGRPMLLHSVQTFMARPDVCAVVCVLPRSSVGDPPPWLFQCDIERLMISVGGRTRQESVANGLDDLPDEAQIVLVHDAARPLVSQATIDRVVETVRAPGGPSVVAAMPVADTLKRVAADGRVVETVAREGLWQAQTPQGFRRETIVGAHRAAREARIDATDDAALCERLGLEVRVVPGTRRAAKVTTEGDFRYVEALFHMNE